MSLVRRALSVSFEMVSQPIGDAKSVVSPDDKDQIQISSGLRISAMIAHAGMGQSTAMLRIYGLSTDHMNRLSTTGKTLASYGSNDIVTVFAGVSGGAMTQVFTGALQFSCADMSESPNHCLMVSAVSKGFERMAAVLPTSYAGNVPIDTVMKGIAILARCDGLENNGVNGFVTNPYYWGSPVMQAGMCAFEGNFNFQFDKNVLVIVPNGGVRTGGTIPVISAETGMVGYPTGAQNNFISVDTEYNPDVRVLGAIEVRSTILNSTANGKWGVQSMEHHLESETPGGAWFTHIECNRNISTTGATPPGQQPAGT